MHIISGLFNHMVVQRNSRNLSQADFAGACAASGPVRASVTRNRKPVRGFTGRTVGRAARGKLRGCLAGLPVGGPYRVTLRVAGETLVVDDVLVGDVWLLGGQSNMQGCGLFPKKRLPSDPQVRAFYMSDRWGVARDPIHSMWECVDPVHVDLNGGIQPVKPDPDWGVCPGPSFGNEMRRLTGGVPQGLIACAHGGTSMAQWDPAKKAEGGKSLYGAMIRRLEKNGGRVAGLVWYQGCSDAGPDVAPLYTERMKALVAALRRDSGDKALPVVIVQISRVIGWPPSNTAPWNSIQEQQRLLPRAIRRLETVPAIDLPLDDGIHIGGEGQYVLGVRLARAMQSLCGGRKAGPPPIVLKKVTVETVRGAGVAVAEFGNVVGRLRSGSRPCGFTVAMASGAGNVFDVQLDGPRARVRSTLSPTQLVDSALHYGYGPDPVCTITDEAGRPLPVFGPVPLGWPRALTPFLRQVRVSAFQPSAGNLDSLDYPADPGALGLAPRTFGEDFCNLHQQIVERGQRDEVVYYAVRFACAEPMRLALLLGYDGPVKVWLDGRKLFHDPNGTNPAFPDKGQSRFGAAVGGHELLVALSTHNGLAWGVFLRLQRLDVAKRKIRVSGGDYAMPEPKG